MQLSVDRITTSLSLDHQRKNKQTKKPSTNLTVYEAYTNNGTNLQIRSDQSLSRV